MSRIINLDVGGELFETTLTTLSRYPDSVLAKMFDHSENGLAPMQKTESGNYFLDVNPDSFRTILNWLRPGGYIETEYITKSVLDLANYFGLHDFPKIEDELITLDLNGEKQIKILKRTITRHSKTDLAKFFNEETSEPLLGPLPIFEIKPGHYFVDRPAKKSEILFSFLKEKFVIETFPYSEELETELEFYGFVEGKDFFKLKDGLIKDFLSWESHLAGYMSPKKTELIILDLNGNKQIKILRRTLTKEPSTHIGTFFSDTLIGGTAFNTARKSLPIFETQLGHFFVDRPLEKSEAVFNLLKGAVIKKSGEIKYELALYGYFMDSHYFEIGPNKDQLCLVNLNQM